MTDGHGPEITCVMVREEDFISLVVKYVKSEIYTIWDTSGDITGDMRQLYDWAMNFMKHYGVSAEAVEELFREYNLGEEKNECV